MALSLIHSSNGILGTPPLGNFLFSGRNGRTMGFSKIAFPGSFPLSDLLHSSPGYSVIRESPRVRAYALLEGLAWTFCKRRSLFSTSASCSFCGPPSIFNRTFFLSEALSLYGGSFFSPRDLQKLRIPFSSRRLLGHFETFGLQFPPSARSGSLETLSIGDLSFLRFFSVRLAIVQEMEVAAASFAWLLLPSPPYLDPRDLLFLGAPCHR